VLKPRAVGLLPVCLTVKPVGEPDAGDRHVRFDERGWETGRCRMAQATAPILDSTELAFAAVQNYVRFLGYGGREMLAVRFSHFDARPTFCVTTRECATDKSGSGLSAMRRPVWT
jgi:hypothetical protein